MNPLKKAKIEYIISIMGVSLSALGLAFALMAMRFVSNPMSVPLLLSMISIFFANLTILILSRKRYKGSIEKLPSSTGILHDHI